MQMINYKVYLIFLEDLSHFLHFFLYLDCILKATNLSFFNFFIQVMSEDVIIYKLFSFWIKTGNCF